MTPAVTASAPVGAPQSAAPPGSGPPGAQGSSDEPFGTILDSARTAAAEGQGDTGTKPGAQKSSASSDGTQPVRADGPDPAGTSNSTVASAAPTADAPAAAVGKHRAEGKTQSATGGALLAALAGQLATAPTPGKQASAKGGAGATATVGAEPVAQRGSSQTTDATTVATTVATDDGSAAGSASDVPGGPSLAPAGQGSPAQHSASTSSAAPGSAAPGSVSPGSVSPGAVPPSAGSTANVPADPPSSGPDPTGRALGAQVGALVASSPKPPLVADHTSASRPGATDSAGTTAGTPTPPGTARSGSPAAPADGQGRPDPAQGANQSAAKPAATADTQAAGVIQQLNPSIRALSATPAHTTAPGDGTADLAALKGGASADPGHDSGHPDGHESSGQRNMGPASWLQDPSARAAGGAGTAATAGSQPSFASAATQATSGAGQTTPNPPSTSATFIRQPVPLEDAVQTIRATFTAVNQSGAASARISLAPASLGGITISLSQTPEGLVARVIADHPEALQTLQQNAGELRQSLAQSGMTLLHLDIGSAGGESLGGAGGQNQFGSGSGSAGPSRYGTDADAGDDQPPSVTQTILQLNHGALVNVLA